MKHVYRFSLDHVAGSFVPISRWCIVILGFLACASICLAPGIGQASSVPYDEAGIYSATTDDNVTIMLYRYRPEPAEEFHTNGTPVLLFTGIVENMNQYLSCTPDGMEDSYARMEMPTARNIRQRAIQRLLRPHGDARDHFRLGT